MQQAGLRLTCMIRQSSRSAPAERRAAMTWAQRLKRVLGIDIETCSGYGRAVRIIACIEDPAVIEKILSHLETLGAEPLRIPSFFALR